jgi:rubredoxin
MDLDEFVSPYWTRFEEYHVNNKAKEVVDYTDLPVFEVVHRNRLRSDLDVKMDVMDLIYETLHKLDKPPKARQAIQVEIHNMIVPMTVKMVFGAKLFNEHKAMIMKKYNFTETDIHPLLSALTPRRCGKTWCIAMFIVVMLVCVPRIKIAILSRIIPQCVDMMNEARAFLADYFPHIELFKDNKLTMCYRASETDSRWIRAYPSQADNVRGIGADLIICEEAAFMNELLVKRIIIPILGMENTAIVCITTRSNEPYGFFEAMINKPLDDIEGGTVFKQYNYDFVCDPCKAMGMEAMETCKHQAAKRPSFQSDRNHKLIRILLEDNKADLLRETMGIDPDDRPTVFRKEVILKVCLLVAVCLLTNGPSKGVFAAETAILPKLG